jgi:hypothetical protein
MGKIPYKNPNPKWVRFVARISHICEEYYDLWRSVVMEEGMYSAQH